jgi:superfamily II DNA or RNA helicase
MRLRPLQAKAIDDLRAAYRAGYRAPVLVAPTGFGKTATSCVLIRSAVEKRQRVWFLAHLREILAQTSAKLTAEGIGHGWLAAGQTPAESPVQLCMMQTVVRRLDHLQPPDLVIVDEAHTAVSESYQTILRWAGNAKRLFLTATPERTDGRGLGQVADALVPTCSTQHLIDAGLLAPIRYYAPSRPDLSGVRTVAGDYAQGEVADAMNRPTITGDAVAHYAKLAHGRPCVVFCTNVRHAEDTAEAFRAADYRALAISGESQSEDRDRALRGLADGSLDVVVNCQLWVAGVDCPSIGCVVLLAPTKSVTKYLQSVGRGLRTAPGKTDLIVLDHAGNAYQHGLPTEAREWSLEGVKRRSRAEGDVESVRQCERCYFVFPPAPVCPSCGHEHQPKQTKIQQCDGELEQLTEVKREKRREVGKARTIGDLIQIAKDRGYAMGWVWQMARVKGIKA